MSVMVYVYRPIEAHKPILGTFQSVASEINGVFGVSVDKFELDCSVEEQKAHMMRLSEAFMNAFLVPAVHFYSKLMTSYEIQSGELLQAYFFKLDVELNKQFKIANQFQVETPGDVFVDGSLLEDGDLIITLVLKEEGMYNMLPFYYQNEKTVWPLEDMFAFHHNAFVTSISEVSKSFGILPSDAVITTDELNA